MELGLAIQYIRCYGKKNKVVLPLPNPLPMVTLQLPVYNEFYVVSRLLDAVGELNYPKDRLDIQLLDDSTDETTDLGAEGIQKLCDNGFSARQIKRNQRTGYKAGALQNGLKTAKGEFIAFFDADFIPDKNFLMNTLPTFRRPEVACVQTRWTHINASYSLLTRVQAFFLDAHFTVQHSGRICSGGFINFNGTAGVWRKDAITDTGGWCADTLAEDLDLSYRAQMKGWKIVYLGDMCSPAELPVSMQALKSQQYRWIKGGAETAKKLLPSLFSSGLSPTILLLAIGHLMSSTVYVLILFLMLLSLPLVWYKNTTIPVEYKYYLLPFLLSNVAVVFSYFTASVVPAPNRLKATLQFLWVMPLFFIITMGLSFHNAIAALSGWCGIKTPFVRTPKFNLCSDNTHWKSKLYNESHARWSVAGEFFMFIYCAAAVVAAFCRQEFFMTPMHLLGILGYGTVLVLSIRHRASQ